jgi:hypothetical protein
VSYAPAPKAWIYYRVSTGELPPTALGLPPGVHSYAILPIGYPMGKFGPVGRGPLKEIVYQDHWGTPYQGI